MSFILNFLKGECVLKEENGKRNSKHHIVPRSRMKRKHNNGKTVHLPESFHRAWHVLFGNLYGKELFFFIEEVNSLMKDREIISGLELKEIRREIIRKEIY